MGRSEIDIQKHGKQFQSVENSMGVVHSTQGNLKPASPHKSEISIVCELANEILGNSPVNWMELRENYNRIRNLISKCIPGFDNYNQKIKQKYGFYYQILFAIVKSFQRVMVRLISSITAYLNGSLLKIATL